MDSFEKRQRKREQFRDWYFTRDEGKFERKRADYWEGVAVKNELFEHDMDQSAQVE